MAIFGRSRFAFKKKVQGADFTRSGPKVSSVIPKEKVKRGGRVQRKSAFPEGGGHTLGDEEEDEASTFGRHAACPAAKNSRAWAAEKRKNSERVFPDGLPPPPGDDSDSESDPETSARAKRRKRLANPVQPRPKKLKREVVSDEDDWAEGPQERRRAPAAEAGPGQMDPGRLGPGSLRPGKLAPSSLGSPPAGLGAKLERAPTEGSGGAPGKKKVEALELSSDDSDDNSEVDDPSDPLAFLAGLAAGTNQKRRQK